MSYKNNITKYTLRGIQTGLLLTVAMTLSACKTNDIFNISQTYNEGYVLDSAALETIPAGSSREQVLLTLGSPSTTAMYDNEVFYYISQTRYRSAQFMKPRIVDRRTLAIYFNNKGKVAKIANYGLQDGKLFDFASRTTSTGGKDQSFLSQLLIQGTKAVSAGIPTNSH